MTRHSGSLPAAYFADLYASNPDPWNFAASDYERQKYAATLSALGQGRYASGLEIGCSIGVLTRQLAQRCDRLLALDLSERALVQARARCADLDHVRFLAAKVPDDWPAGSFDLIVLSEVIYYLDRADLARLVAQVRDSLLSGGEAVLVHWTGETNYPLGGDEAAELFLSLSADFAQIRYQTRSSEYRMDVIVVA